MNGSQAGLRARGPALVAITLSLLAGCAPVPAPTAGAPVPPASSSPAAHVPTPAVPTPAPRREPARTAAAVDSAPSSDAIRVLAAIPEPLTPAQQVPPPERAPGTVTAPAPEAAYDTLRVERAAETDSTGVPVPSPTQPLGNAAAGTLVMPDTLSAPPAAPAAAQAPATPPHADSRECLRLQIAAPEERAKAESRREAAQSLLVVPMVIEFEHGLYKVRTRDCMSRETADALKLRAMESGFPGAFVVNTAALPPPRPAVHKSAHPAPTKHPKRRTR